MIGEVHDFEIEVKGKGTDGIHASGMIFSFLKDDFAPGTDFQRVFKRWTEMNSFCESSPSGNASAKHPENIFVTTRLNRSNVCARLVGGSLDLNGYMVTLNTGVVPEGPKGEKLKTYLKSVDKIKVRPRLIYDSSGKITGVPYWDLVLPRDWETTIYVYNDIEDEDFIEDLQTLVGMCARKSVGWGMTYAEVTKDWYFTINSAAESECFTGKNKMLKHALEDVIKHVENIGK